MGENSHKNKTRDKKKFTKNFHGGQLSGGEFSLGVIFPGAFFRGAFFLEPVTP